MVTVDKVKTYLGCYTNASLAAKIYDISLIQNQGIKVKAQIRSCQSNFKYTKAQLLAILFERNLVYTKSQQ